MEDVDPMIASHRSEVALQEARALLTRAVFAACLNVGAASPMSVRP